MNLAIQPFEKWGIDFVGPISLGAINSKARYIIVAINSQARYIIVTSLNGQKQKPCVRQMLGPLLNFCMNK